MIIPVSFWWKPASPPVTCTWDPANQTYPVPDSRAMALTNGNRTAQANSLSGLAAPPVILCTVGHTSGKWYYEMINDAMNVGVSAGPGLGIANVVTDVGLFSNGIYVVTDSGDVWVDNSVPFSGTTWSVGDRAGVAVDIGAGKVWLAHNNVWYLGSDPATATGGFTLTAAGLNGALPLFPALRTAGGDGIQKATLAPASATFSFSPPAGFSPWCSGS